MSLVVYVTMDNLGVYILIGTKEKIGRWSLISFVSTPDTVSENSTFVTQISSNVELAGLPLSAG